MSDPLLLYGATGFTGRLILQSALALGLRPLLGGRDAAKLAALAEPLGLSWRAAGLADTTQLDVALAGVRVVLHAAGPFSQTAAPMAAACLRVGVHYLDVTGEIPVIERLAQRDREARQRGIMLMPGTGFDVVPSDCLAAHVAARLPDATTLRLGLTGLAFATRGSASTLAEHAGIGVNVRRGGAITPVAPGALRRRFDFGDGPRDCCNVSWGDVAAAYYTTGIPDIAVYFEATPTVEAMLLASRTLGWMLRSAPWQAWLKAHAALLPEGPSEAERAPREMVIVAEASDAGGRTARARLRTPEAYTFTGQVAPAIARRVLRGDYEPGFQTPGRVYGADYVLGFAGVAREDLGNGG
ncbi:MAG TPA: saccharopine dehydrogenase NADP-binding domain-containing protein [Candidatus Dormibacteraeota bacterium]|nr:saccharopine dehydrogenase NADP-binding domain-containing protein [Candidatus Dormibacteraeota bacterium]